MSLSRFSSHLPDLKNSKYAALFEEIIQQLDKQQQQISQLEISSNIYSSYSKIDDFQNVIEKIINNIWIPNLNHIRILLFRPFFDSEEISNCSVHTQGVLAEEFSYLDEQIYLQLKSKSPFIIADTLKTRSIKFHPDLPFPKAIVAYQLIFQQKCIGFYWFGFNEIIPLNRSEINFYNRTNETINTVIDNYFSTKDLDTRIHIVLELLKIYDEPFILFRNGKSIFSNKKADLLWTKDEQPHPDLEKILNMPGKGTNNKNTITEIEIDKKNYQVMTSFMNDDYLNYAVIIFKNISLEGKRRDLHAIALESLAQMLKTPLVESQAMIKMINLLGDLNSNQRTYIENIQKNIDNNLMLIDDLTTIERMNVGEGLLIDEVIIKEIIDHVLEILKPRISQKRIEIKQNSDFEKILLVDKKMITHAIYLVMEFIINQTNMDTVIILEGKQNAGSWGLSVIDQSRTFSKSEFDRILKAEFHLDIEKNLYLANRIFSLLGVKLNFMDQLEQGNQYQINIPN